MASQASVASKEKDYSTALSRIALRDPMGPTAGQVYEAARARAVARGVPEWTTPPLATNQAWLSNVRQVLVAIRAKDLFGKPYVGRTGAVRQRLSVRWKRHIEMIGEGGIKTGRSGKARAGVDFEWDEAYGFAAWREAGFSWSAMPLQVALGWRTKAIDHGFVKEALLDTPWSSFAPRPANAKNVSLVEDRTLARDGVTWVYSRAGWRSRIDAHAGVDAEAVEDEVPDDWTKVAFDRHPSTCDSRTFAQVARGGDAVGPAPSGTVPDADTDVEVVEDRVVAKTEQARAVAMLPPFIRASEFFKDDQLVGEFDPYVGEFVPLVFTSMEVLLREKTGLLAMPGREKFADYQAVLATLAFMHRIEGCAYGDVISARRARAWARSLGRHFQAGDTVERYSSRLAKTLNVAKHASSAQAMAAAKLRLAQAQLLHPGPLVFPIVWVAMANLVGVVWFLMQTVVSFIVVVFLSVVVGAPLLLLTIGLLLIFAKIILTRVSWPLFKLVFRTAAGLLPDLYQVWRGVRGLWRDPLRSARVATGIRMRNVAEAHEDQRGWRYRLNAWLASLSAPTARRRMRRRSPPVPSGTSPVPRSPSPSTTRSERPVPPGPEPVPPAPPESVRAPSPSPPVPPLTPHPTPPRPHAAAGRGPRRRGAASLARDTLASVAAHREVGVAAVEVKLIGGVGGGASAPVACDASWRESSVESGGTTSTVERVDLWTLMARMGPDVPTQPGEDQMVARKLVLSRIYLITAKAKTAAQATADVHAYGLSQVQRGLSLDKVIEYQSILTLHRAELGTMASTAATGMEDLHAIVRRYTGTLTD
jgi:hypothetical protein